MPMRGFDIDRYAFADQLTAHGLDESPGEIACSFFVASRRDDQKLPGGSARYLVVGTSEACEPPRHLAQQRIAHVFAEGCANPINIRPDRAAAARCSRHVRDAAVDGALQVLCGRQAIRQACQFIAGGLIADALLHVRRCVVASNSESSRRRRTPAMPAQSHRRCSRRTRCAGPRPPIPPAAG